MLRTLCVNHPLLLLYLQFSPLPIPFAQERITLRLSKQIKVLHCLKSFYSIWHYGPNTPWNFPPYHLSSFHQFPNSCFPLLHVNRSPCNLLSGFSSCTHTCESLGLFCLALLRELSYFTPLRMMHGGEEHCSYSSWCEWFALEHNFKE